MYQCEQLVKKNNIFLNSLEKLKSFFFLTHLSLSCKSTTGVCFSFEVQGVVMHQLLCNVHRHRLQQISIIHHHYSIPRVVLHHMRKIRNFLKRINHVIRPVIRNSKNHQIELLLCNPPTNVLARNSFAFRSSTKEEPSLRVSLPLRRFAVWPLVVVSSTWNINDVFHPERS